jgi:hypothetical protein
MELHVKALMSGMASEELKMILKAQYKRQWNIHIDPFKSKWQFLRYAGRYFLRPPISQSRFVSVTEAEVHFRTKDLKEKGVVLTRIFKREVRGPSG